MITIRCKHCGHIGHIGKLRHAVRLVCSRCGATCALQQTLIERDAVIRSKHQAGVSQQQLAHEYGLSRKRIRDICDRMIIYRNPMQTARMALFEPAND